jgi:hypothetical protein
LAVQGRQDSGTAYSAGQYDDGYPPGVERHFWHVARNWTIKATLDEWSMASVPLLEIGCGRGIIVDYLQRRGVDCIGCDPGNPPVPAHLSGSVYTKTDFRDLPEARRARIRGALLCDVLEHVREQGELLRDVVRFLPGVKHILVTVPARPELWSGWDDHYGHFRRYTSDMLVDEIASAGLTPLSVRYFLHALYPPMFFARGRRRATTIAAPKLAPIHKLLGTALYVEGRLLPRGLVGTSLIAVARVG